MRDLNTGVLIGRPALAAKAIGNAFNLFVMDPAIAALNHVTMMARGVSILRMNRRLVRRGESYRKNLLPALLNPEVKETLNKLRSRQTLTAEDKDRLRHMGFPNNAIRSELLDYMQAGLLADLNPENPSLGTYLEVLLDLVDEAQVINGGGRLQVSHLNKAAAKLSGEGRVARRDAQEAVARWQTAQARTIREGVAEDFPGSTLGEDKRMQLLRRLMTYQKNVQAANNAKMRNAPTSRIFQILALTTFVSALGNVGYDVFNDHEELLKEFSENSVGYVIDTLLTTPELGLIGSSLAGVNSVFEHIVTLMAQDNGIYGGRFNSYTDVPRLFPPATTSALRTVTRTGDAMLRGITNSFEEESLAPMTKALPNFIPYIGVLEDLVNTLGAPFGIGTAMQLGGKVDGYGSTGGAGQSLSPSKLFPASPQEMLMGELGLEPKAAQEVIQDIGDLGIEAPQTSTSSRMSKRSPFSGERLTEADIRRFDARAEDLPDELR